MEGTRPKRRKKKELPLAEIWTTLQLIIIGLLIVLLVTRCHVERTTLRTVTVTDSTHLKKY